MEFSSSAFQYVISIFFLLYICKLKATDNRFGEFQGRVFNIMQFGAVADAKTDSSKALSTAWSQACNGGGSVLIPKGTFLVLPVMLQGPCHGLVRLQINGVLRASADRAYGVGEHWIAVHQVNNVVVDGDGVLDGQGASVWAYNRCQNGGKCDFPATLRLDNVNTATIRNIKSINSKNFHFKVYGSQLVTIDHVSLTAPGNSPNTDGIHISMSTNINIINSVIATGDDCVSIGPGSKAINITGVQCGPGHGISIGSLGQYQNEGDVSGVTVQHSTFLGTDNGVRIKTMSSPYKSMVSGVKFMHLLMNNVKNPIIIDQYYCPHNSCQQQGHSQVQIQDVRYEDITGTSMSKVAVMFGCSGAVPCQGIVLQDINLGLAGGGATTASCSNVKGSANGKELPPPCL